MTVMARLKYEAVLTVYTNRTQVQYEMPLARTSQKSQVTLDQNPDSSTICSLALSAVDESSSVACCGVQCSTCSTHEVARAEARRKGMDAKTYRC